MKKINKLLKTASTLIAGLLIISGATVVLDSSQASARLPGPDPVSTPQSAQQQFEDKCDNNFFGLVPWYHYIDMEFANNASAPKDAKANPCAIKCFNFFVQSTPNECGRKASDIPAVALAIVDDLLRVAGMLAVIYVIVGAFKYVTSEGKPDDTAKAQSTIINALMGLAIALTAVAFVSFIGNKLGG